MKKWVKFTIAGSVFAVAIVYLMITGFSGHSVYYLEIGELLSKPELYNAKGVRLSGKVADGTIVRDDLNSKTLKFKITDNESLGNLNIEYGGVVPDSFVDGVSVILEGHYEPKNTTFYAKTLMTKCPSRYEGEDPALHNNATK